MSFTHVRFLAELYLLLWKMGWTPRYKLLITSNLEALTAACLKNCTKTWNRHMEFYSTLLYARYEKKRSNRVFEMKGEIKLFQELEANEFTSYIVTRFGGKILLILQKFLKIEWLKSKASRKGYKHHPAWRWICKHFIRSCKTVVGK